MNIPQISEHIRGLMDDYLDGTIAADQLAELEDLLARDTQVLDFFVRYAQTHTDLVFEAASRAATTRAMAQIAEPPRSTPASATWRSLRWLVAASLLVGMSIGGGVVGLLAQAAPVNVPKPRTLTLAFHVPVADTLADKHGVATGLPQRLPGTGAGLPAHDPHLQLLTETGHLEVEPTASDLNTRFHLEQAEFPGVRLADLGFTGSEDFEVAVTVVDVPQLAFVGQFGLFAGTTADWAVRGGLVSQRQPDSYRQFLVNTRDGRDKDAYFVGLGAPGDALRIRLSRVGGKFSMSVENRTTGATSSLTIRHPEFLDGRGDLVAGLFACEPRGQDHRPVRFSEFSVTVWTTDAR